MKARNMILSGVVLSFFILFFVVLTSTSVNARPCSSCDDCSLHQQCNLRTNRCEPCPTITTFRGLVCENIGNTCNIINRTCWREDCDCEAPSVDPCRGKLVNQFVDYESGCSWTCANSSAKRCTKTKHDFSCGYALKYCRDEDYCQSSCGYSGYYLCPDKSKPLCNDKTSNVYYDEKCPDDVWVDTGDWTCHGACKRCKPQEYHDYGCSSGNCTYTVTQTREYCEYAPVDQHCSNGNFTTEGYCGSSQAYCSGDCIFSIDKYECNTDHTCTKTDYSEQFNCPADTSCSFGQCRSDVACGMGNAQCNGCKISQEFRRCDRSGSCAKFWKWSDITSCNPYSCSAGSCTNNCSKACGAECDTDAECNNKCVGSVRYFNGTCSSCECSYSSEDCDDFDGWYNTSTTRWVDCNDKCKECEELQQEQRDYSCDPDGCTYEITGHRWIKTNRTRDKECPPGYYCSNGDCIPYCGNGVIDPGEECDPPGTSETRECNNNNHGTQGRECLGNCHWSDWSDCTYCGDNILQPAWEQCELPFTNNNHFCEQNVSQCLGKRFGVRDQYGNCSSTCRCLFDDFSYSCVKNKCGATCESEEDCPNYCSDSIRYFNGDCTDCSCSYSSENCDDLDSTVDTGNTKWITCPDDSCKECEQKEQEIRDYDCYASGCKAITTKQWVDTDNRRDKYLTGCTGYGDVFSWDDPDATFTTCVNGKKLTKEIKCDFLDQKGEWTCIDSKTRKRSGTDYFANENCECSSNPHEEVETCSPGFTCQDGECVKTCEGFVNLELEGDTVCPKSKIKVNVQGLFSCDSKKAIIKLGGCGEENKQLGYCRIRNGVCKVNIKAPENLDKNEIYVCLDKNGDSDYNDEGELDFKILTTDCNVCSMYGCTVATKVGCHACTICGQPRLCLNPWQDCSYFNPGISC